MKRCLFLLAWVGVGALCFAEEAGPKAKPAVREVSPGMYQLGVIRIDAAKREVSFPAEIGEPNRELEYALVCEKGKSYESLLVTSFAAMDLQVALLLSNYKTWPEGPFRRDENAQPSPRVPEAELSILVEWEDPKTGKQSAPLHAWLTNRETNKPLAAQGWVFNGIKPAEPNGPPLDLNQLVAVFLDRYSPINYDGPDNRNDDIWLATPKVVPPAKTKVTVRIGPRETASTTTKKP